MSDLSDLTFDKLITPKMIYVIKSLGRSYDSEEEAETVVCNTTNIGRYYKFYEVFYAPSYTRRSKRYTKFMMIMTRRTVAIHSEVTSYLTNELGLEPIVFISEEWGWRDNWMIVETDLSTATQVYDKIQEDLKIDGGLQPGGNELAKNGVGTLHLIKYDGTPILIGTPKSANDIFEYFVGADEKEIPTPIPTTIDLDKDYI